MLHLCSVITTICMPNYRSGAEDEYDELSQLLEDISAYMRDFEELKAKEKDEKKKEADDKRKAEDMRRGAMEGMASMFEHCHACIVF